MKKIRRADITNCVSRLCIEANTILRSDVLVALHAAYKAESNPRAKKFLDRLFENADIAKKEKIALCQDTGLPVVFVDIGKDIDISGVDIVGAITDGVEDGYGLGHLRNSIVPDPLCRNGESKFTPPVIHFDFVKHKGLKLTVLPKGFGCENKTKLKMFNPTASISEIEDFIVFVVKDAGPDACPPYVIGVGIGGTSDYACILAKKALLKKVHSPWSIGHGKSEKNLLKKINKLNIGPMGLRGKTTALAVNILTYPTHIAGLPVCVNISCHALRSATKIL